MRRSILAFVVISLVATSAFAQSMFRIDHIEVRNAHRVSPKLIAAETMLREGGSYSEDDLRVAVARAGRLPLLLRADYTIENGVLVISVTEMKPLSFLLDARGIELSRNRIQTVIDSSGHVSERIGRTSKFDYDFTDPTLAWKDAAAGARWITDGSGFAHFAMTVYRTRHTFDTNYSAYELGYTRYGLFGTRLFATAIVRSPVDSLAEHTFTPAAAIGLPLSSRQTLSLDYTNTLFRHGQFHVAGSTFRLLHEERQLTLAWTYDTTNQPYAPSRGTLIRIAPMRWMRDDAGFTSQRTGFVAASSHNNANGIDFVALHHWELSPISSVSAGVLGGWSSLESSTPALRQHPSYQILQGGYSRALGASRVELVARLVNTQRDVPNARAGSGNEDDTTGELGVNWIRRSTWGTFRLGVVYSRD